MKSCLFGLNPPAGTVADAGGTKMRSGGFFGEGASSNAGLGELAIVSGLDIWYGNGDDADEDPASC